MAGERNFEEAWHQKFRDSLDIVAGRSMREKIVAAGGKLKDKATSEDVTEWTTRVMEKLDSLLGEDVKREVMTACACHYPHEELEDVRKAYVQTNDIGVAHGMLQSRFVSFLETTLDLDEAEIADIVEKGWGVAGVRDGQTIVATKIPKSGTLREYLKETDPQKRKALYCHCPRIKDAIERGVRISPTYCYCGAGFYKDIWEFITQRPVSVEILESVLSGGEVCKIRILFPEDSG